MVISLMVKPGEQPCLCPLLDDEDYWNAVVSIGATIMCTAAVLPIEDDIVAIYAWDGAMAGLRGNRKIGKRIIAGTFYVVRVVDGRLQSLTKEDVASFSRRFCSAQEYDDEMVIDSWLDSLFPAT